MRKIRIVDMVLCFVLTLLTFFSMAMKINRVAVFTLSILTVISIIFMLVLIGYYSRHRKFAISSVFLFLLWPLAWLFKRNYIFSTKAEYIHKAEMVVAVLSAIIISIIWFFVYRKINNNTNFSNVKEKNFFYSVTAVKNMVFYFLFAMTLIFYININFSPAEDKIAEMQVCEKTDEISYVYFGTNERKYIFESDDAHCDSGERYPIYISENEGLEIGDKKTFLLINGLNGIEYYWISD